MLTFANAKINLGLNLTEKRSDGYHNLETVFYPIKLYDVVELIDAEVTTCITKGVEIPGSGEDNICLKAFKILQNDFNLPNQQIVLLKNIPVGAGLGGGSADAAFLIKLINEKFDLKMSLAKMQDYARDLGADCAFFIDNQPVYAFGKGDQFEDLVIDFSKYFLVLVKPNIHVSTAEAYQNIEIKTPLKSLKNLIQLPITVWKDHIFNDFESTVFQKYPEIEKIKSELYASGATFALMSGSGSSVFAIFEKPVKLPELEKENQVFYGL